MNEYVRSFQEPIILFLKFFLLMYEQINKKEISPVP